MVKAEDIQPPPRGPPLTTGPSHRIHGLTDTFKYSFYNDSINGPQTRGNYQPSWVRATQPPPGKREAENNLNETLVGDPLGSMRRVSNEMRERVPATAAQLQGHGHTAMEKEFIAPPKRGGYQGYDEERGKNPIPRFHRYDLGEDRSAFMSDTGASRGAAVGKLKGVPERGQSWEIMPTRAIEQKSLSSGGIKGAGLPGGRGMRTPAPLGAALSQTVDNNDERQALEWHHGPTGQKGLAGKGLVYPEDDPGDRRFTLGHVNAYASNAGAGKESLVKGVSMRGASVDFSTVPESTKEILEKSQGVSYTSGVDRGVWVPDASDRVQRGQTRPLGAHAKGLHAGKAAQLTQGSTAREKTYSFHLKDILKTDAPQTLTSRKNIEPTLSNPHERHAVDPGLPSVRREAPDVLPSKKTSAPEKMVLFSEEERAAYKRDAKAVDLHRRDDLCDQAVANAQGMARHAGASEFQVNALQFERAGTIPPGGQLNSRLRMQTSGAPQPWAPTGQRPTEYKASGDFLNSNTHISAPRLNTLPQGGGQGLGKGTAEYHAAHRHDPEASSSIHVDKLDGVSTSFDGFGGASRFHGASAPPRLPGNENEIDDHPYNTDEILERGGHNLMEIKAMKNPGSRAVLDRLEKTNAQRERNEFRRKS